MLKLVEVAAPGAPAPVGALVTVVDATTPLVKGVLPSVAVEAPGKATAVVDGFGSTVEFAGLRTLDFKLVVMFRGQVVGDWI